MNESNLHNYQIRCKNHIIENPFCGLFLDMGLGKTVSTLTAIKHLMYEELDVDKVLVIAPKRVAESVWSDECDKWDHLNNFKVTKIIGTKKQREAALKEKSDIYMIGRDNIVWLCGQYGGSMLPFDMLVVDESSSFKSPKSLRFKALRKVQPSFNRVVILTGTPAPNGLIDLWSQIYLLDRGHRLGKTISTYRDEYFRPGLTVNHVTYKYNLKKDHDHLIHQKISDICMSMKAKDYLELPERIDNFINIELPEKIKTQYEDFEREQVLAFLEDDDEITAFNAAGLSNKLLQFANGAVYDEDKNYKEVHKLKLDALEEIVTDANGKPVMVAYAYRHDLERIMQRLHKYKPVKMETAKHMRDWNEGKIQVMVMHPASAGHGLNLQSGGNTIVWFGQTWSLELYMQLNARLHRQGQTKPVIVNHLVTKGTIDVDVHRSIKRKDAKQDGLMEAIKARIEKYKEMFDV